MKFQQTTKLRKNLINRFLVGLFAGCLSILTIYNSHAQDTFHQWESPSKITYSGNFVSQPFMVSDSGGVLHAIWSESVLGQNDQRPDTIYYASWDGTRWSNPMDIFATDENGRAEAQRLRIDEKGYLHALWISSDDGLVYSKSHVTQSNNYRSWNLTIIPENVHRADFTNVADVTTAVVKLMDHPFASYQKTKY